MFEIILLAAAGVAGYFLGRHLSPAEKDHTAMIDLMAFSSRAERKAILSIPATPSLTLPGTATVVSPLPLFTSDEKKEILKEVSLRQQELMKAGQHFTPDQIVTPEEMELAPAAAAPVQAPPQASAGGYPTVGMSGQGRFMTSPFEKRPF